MANYPTPAFPTDTAPPFWALCGFLTPLLLLGGAPSNLGPRVGFLLLCALGFAVFAVDWPRLWADRRARWLILGAAIICLLPALQLIPLPPIGDDPLRRIAADIRAIVAPAPATSFRPISLTPDATLLSALIAIIPFAALLLGMGSTATQRQWALRLLVLFGALTLIIGTVQVASAGAALNFYDSPHGGLLIGFFANRNHNALAMALSTLALMACIAQWPRFKFKRLALLLTLWVGMALILATRSRSGLVIGFSGLMLYLWWMARAPDTAIRRRDVAISAVALLAGGVGLYWANDIAHVGLARFETLSSDARYAIWAKSWVLAIKGWPLGFGFGSFPTIYDVAEQSRDVTMLRMNHAHNDYLEWLVEGGIAALMAMIATLATIIGLSIRGAALDEAPRAGGTSDRRFAIIAVLMILMASASDYPLRTPAMAALFALLIGFLYAAMARKNNEKT